MSISSLIKRKSVAEPYNVNQVWVREFINGKGETVLLQLYSPSGGFTYPHRQLLGKLFGESYPKGYWVSRESFEAALKRMKLRDAGKLRQNAWTLSALVNSIGLKEILAKIDFLSPLGPVQEEAILAKLEADLIENLAREKIRIINAIQSNPGTENTEFHFVKVDLTNEQQPRYENMITALGFFATNTPTLKEVQYARRHPVMCTSPGALAMSHDIQECISIEKQEITTPAEADEEDSRSNTYLSMA